MGLLGLEKHWHLIFDLKITKKKKKGKRKKVPHELVLREYLGVFNVSISQM